MRNKVMTMVSIGILIIQACQLTPRQPSNDGPTSNNHSVIGNEGGTISHPSGAQLVIPDGAFSYDQDITIDTVNSTDVTAPNASFFIGNIYQIDTEQELFSSPITVTLTYDESMIPDERSEGEIYAAFLYGNEWRRVYGNVDPVSNTVTFETYHASLWTLMMDLLREINYGISVSAYRCIESLIDPIYMPQNQGDADALIAKRQQELEDVFKSWEFEVEEAEDAVWNDLSKEIIVELGVESVVVLTELLTSKAAIYSLGGVPVLAWGGLAMGGLYLFRASVATGEAVSAAYKLEYANQNLMAAHAYKYAIEYKTAKYMPLEYARGLIGICGIELSETGNPIHTQNPFAESTLAAAPNSTDKPANTPIITKDPDIYQPIPGCAASRLYVGDWIKLETGVDYVSIRSYPDTSPSDNKIGRIDGDISVEIIGGPECSYGWIMWEIRTEDGQVGWISESNGEEFWVKNIQEIIKTSTPEGKTTPIKMCSWQEKIIGKWAIPQAPGYGLDFIEFRKDESVSGSIHYPPDNDSLWQGNYEGKYTCLDNGDIRIISSAGKIVAKIEFPTSQILNREVLKLFVKQDTMTDGKKAEYEFWPMGE